MKKDDLVFLKHISEFIYCLENIVKKIDEKNFFEEKIYQDAMIRNLELIGEAARNLSEVFKTKYPEIDWRKIIAMRNILIHEYFDTDLETIWITVNEDIPELKEKIIKILNKLS